jgi:hypothetical protein
MKVYCFHYQSNSVFVIASSEKEAIKIAEESVPKLPTGTSISHNFSTSGPGAYMLTGVIDLDTQRPGVMAFHHCGWNLSVFSSS